MRQRRGALAMARSLVVVFLVYLLALTLAAEVSSALAAAVNAVFWLAFVVIAVRHFRSGRAPRARPRLVRQALEERR